MRFVILAPHQAERIKPLNEDKDSWQDVSKGGIDTSMPYRLFLKDEKEEKIKDRFIDVFFYHGGLSQAIAFQKILKNSGSCADRIEQILKEKKKPPFLENPTL